MSKYYVTLGKSARIHRPGNGLCIMMPLPETGTPSEIAEAVIRRFFELQSETNVTVRHNRLRDHYVVEVQ